MRAGSLRRRVSGVRHVPAWSTCEQVCTALAECGLKAGETRCAQPGRTQEAVPWRAAGRLGAARRAAPLGSPPQKSLEPRPSPREPRRLMSTGVHRPVPHSEGLFPRRSSEDLTPVPDMLAVLAGHPGASHHNRASDSATTTPSHPGLKFVSKAKRPAIPQIVLESSTPGVSRALSCGTQNSSRRRIASRRGRPGASSAQREAAFRVRHVQGARGGRARGAGAFLLLTPPVEASPQRLKPASSYPGLETLLHLLLHADVVGGGGGGRMLDPPPPGSGPGTAWGPEACGRFSAPSDKGGARGRVLGPRRLNAGGPSPLP